MSPADPVARDEQGAIDRLVRLNLRSVPQVVGRAERGQHPKHHGCVAATFRVRADCSPSLRRGVFAVVRDYPALVRFSNGRVRDDRQADAHGMAIKLLDVPGRKLTPGQEQEGAQDFILVDSETFFTGDPADYERVNRALLDKRLVSRAGAWLALLLRPGLLLRIRRFTGKRPASPLASSYFSTVPYRLGEAAIKYVAVPRAGGVEAAAPGDADRLAAALQATLATRDVTFDFGIDLQVDPATQPIEDPTVCWSRAIGAERLWLAELIIPAQAVDPKASLAQNLAFSPWHALPEHEPLGYINCARSPIYRAMAKERHALNQVRPVDTSEAPPSYGDRPVAKDG